MSTFVDKKFIDMVSPQLRNFKWKKNNLANCSCPVCGDSTTNKTKARGFFYQKKNDFFYMCHNCGFSCSLYNFLKKVSPSYAKEYSFERWKGGETGHSNYKKPEFVFTKPVFREPKSFICLTELPEQHPAVRYCADRLIPRDSWKWLYWSDDFSKVAKEINSDPELVVKSEPRLTIPFFDESGNIVAAQGRLLEINSKKDIRYMTIKASESIERLWYGIERCDPSKRVYIVEGPLDSLFLPNSIAMVGGSNLSMHPKIAKSEVVVVLDNQPRNPDVVSTLGKFIDKGFHVCVWDDTVNVKDINDMVLVGMSVDEVKEYIDSHTCSGMVAKLKMASWRKV